MTGVEVVEEEGGVDDVPGTGSVVLPLDQHGGDGEDSCVGGRDGDLETPRTSVSVPFTISINCRTFNIKSRL